MAAPKDGVKVGTIGHVAPPGFGQATDACGVPERKRPASGAALPLPPAGPTGSGGWCEMCGVTHEGPHPAGVNGPLEGRDG